MFKQIKIFAITLLCVGSVWAKPPQFHERFEVLRDDNGLLTEIRIRTTEKASLQKYMQASIAPLMVLQHEGKLNEAALSQHLSIYKYDKWSKKDKREMRKALSKLNEINFSQLINSPEFKTFFRKSSHLISQYGELRRSIARPYEPLYFYNQEIRDFFYEAIFDIISDTFTGGIAEKLIDIMVDRFFNILEQRRAFYQNALLYYVDTYEAEEMGLQQEEIALIESSIFDGRLSWHNLSKRKNAKADWAGFGTQELINMQNECSENFQNHSEKYDQVNGPLSTAFYSVTKNQIQYVYNFDDDAALFSDEPSLAIDLSDLQKVYRARVVLDIINFAIEFLPAPSFVIEIPQLFIERKYRPQIESEGALFAAYSGLENQSMADVVLMQSLNPLLQNTNSQRFTQHALAGF